MSLRSSVYYGRLGHVFYDGYDCAYFWEPLRRQVLRIRLPFRRPWRWLSRRQW